MSERAAFISAILDHWDEDTPRLVFADWLQENGEPDRAEFIRAQIEAEKVPRSRRAASKPGRRAAALEEAHAAEWRAAVGLRRNLGEYDRGFLRDIRIAVHEFETKAGAVLALEPAQFELALRSSPDEVGSKAVPLKWVDGLAKSPLLRTVTTLSSQASRFGAKRFARLMRSPHFAHLREIEVVEDELGAAGIRAIAESPSPFVLESLDLNEVFYDDSPKGQVSAIKIIADSPRFAALKYLGLMFNGLGDKSIRALLASKTLPKTMRLDLEDNDYDAQRFGEELAERFVFESDEDGEVEDRWR